MIGYVIFGGIVLFLLSTVILYGIIWAFKSNLTFLELLKKYFYIPIATFFGSLLISILVYILLRLLLKREVDVENKQEYNPVSVQHEKSRLKNDADLLRLFTNPNPKNEMQKNLDLIEASRNIWEIYHIFSRMDTFLKSSKTTKYADRILIILVDQINSEIRGLNRPIDVNFLVSLKRTKDFISYNRNKLILESTPRC